jgi:CHASE2 domain-containing sensor protein
MDVLGPLLFLSAIVAVYLLPAFVAFKRRHRNRRAILVVNLLLGWTTIGWVVAMVWAFIGDVVPLPPIAATLVSQQDFLGEARRTQERH